MNRAKLDPQTLGRKGWCRDWPASRGAGSSSARLTYFFFFVAFFFVAFFFVAFFFVVFFFAAFFLAFAIHYHLPSRL